jgi:hypothetical protein
MGTHLAQTGQRRIGSITGVRFRGYGVVWPVPTLREPKARHCVVAPQNPEWPGKKSWRTMMRGILLWLIGIPIPVIILLYVFGAVG